MQNNEVIIVPIETQITYLTGNAHDEKELGQGLAFACIIVIVSLLVYSFVDYVFPRCLKSRRKKRK
jgi:hypothetical protein